MRLSSAAFARFTAQLRALATEICGGRLVLALEVVVAVLQAYVFAILTCLYLNDALHLH